jgi:hypothetical protein
MGESGAAVVSGQGQVDSYLFNSSLTPLVVQSEPLEDIAPFGWISVGVKGTG